MLFSSTTRTGGSSGGYDDGTTNGSVSAPCSAALTGHPLLQGRGIAGFHTDRCGTARVSD